MWIDTDALTTGFYCDLLISEMKEREHLCKLADAIHESNQWDLVLFLEPEGTVFVQDGTRNEDIMKERKKYSNMLKAWFDKKVFLMM